MKIEVYIFSSLLFLSICASGPNAFAQYDPTGGLSGETRQTEPETVNNNTSIEYEREGGFVEPVERSTSSKASPKTKTSNTVLNKNKSNTKREELNTAKDLTTPQLGLSKPKTAASSDSKEKQKDANQTQPEDDSVLSFNLFYYMIQKFKFSDLEE